MEFSRHAATPVRPLPQLCTATWRQELAVQHRRREAPHEFRHQAPRLSSSWYELARHGGDPSRGARSTKLAADLSQTLENAAAFRTGGLKERRDSPRYVFRLKRVL